MKTSIVFLFLCLNSLLLFGQKTNLEFNHYLFPEFKVAEILMKNESKRTVVLNYSTLTNEMIIQQDDKMMTINKTMQVNVDTIFIGTQKFVPLSKRFVEHLHKSKDVTLYAEYIGKIYEKAVSLGNYGKSSVSTALSLNNVSFTRTPAFFELELPEDYEVKTFIQYWIKKDGETTKITNLKGVKKFYKPHKKAIKKYIKKHDVDFNDSESMTKLFKFAEAQ